MAKDRLFTPGEALSEMVPWRQGEAVDVSSSAWTDSNNLHPTHIMVNVAGNVGVSLIDSTGTKLTVNLVAGVPYAMRMSKIWTSLTSTAVAANINVFK